MAHYPKSWKEWEKPLLELDEGIAKLKELASKERDPHRKADIEARVREFEDRRDQYIQVKYARLEPWEQVLLARAETRPYTLDYVRRIFTDFVELQGDRLAGSDQALVGGPAKLDGEPVMVIGQQKGRTIQERTQRNFAMMKPDGYRKAMRLMDLADRFRMPVITLIDTPAADPGVESESRGIAESIANSMRHMFTLGVPVVTVIIGEGGSGGALGIAIGDKVLMMEHAIYSVIPPEGCAAILWRQPERGPEASAALKLTAHSALELGAVDEIIPEPFGGAHRNPPEAAVLVKEHMLRALEGLRGRSPAEAKAARRRKYRDVGVHGVAHPLA